MMWNEGFTVKTKVGKRFPITLGIRGSYVRGIMNLWETYEKGPCSMVQIMGLLFCSSFVPGSSKETSFTVAAGKGTGLESDWLWKDPLTDHVTVVWVPVTSGLRPLCTWRVGVMVSKGPSWVLTVQDLC